MKALLFTILLLVSSEFLFGIDSDSLKIKNDDVKIYAIRLTSPIHLDGKLNEPFWQQIKGFESFIQLEPIEGVQPTERTVVKIAYDDNALYKSLLNNIGGGFYIKYPNLYQNTILISSFRNR